MPARMAPGVTKGTPEPFADRYRLVDELGVGGAGNVWRAEDLQDGGECAASILAELSHPNLVGLLDYGTAGGDGYPGPLCVRPSD